jgi:hypothetical protein
MMGRGFCRGVDAVHTCTAAKQQYDQSNIMLARSLGAVASRHTMLDWPSRLVSG